MRPRLWAAAAAFAAACSFVLPGVAAASSAARRACGYDGYSYAGLLGKQNVSGVAATIVPLRDPVVESGHVAAWVGVGGPGMGPDGSDEWIQVGIDRKAGAQSRVYFEFATPTAPPDAATIVPNVRPGEKHRFAVTEIPSRPGTWQAWVDGRRVGKPVYLAGSHDAWTPVATAESWDGGVPACNQYTYSFDGVAVTTPGSAAWRSFGASSVLQDPGYSVVQVAPASFRAGMSG